jgi:uncharacterized protein (DUF488 family)
LNSIYTVGHSTHTAEVFIRLLTQHEITAVADVRSVPASRFTPQFNKEPLKRALREADVEYVFLGRELGARSDNPACYEDGQVRYDRLAQTPEFAAGIDRLRRGVQTQRIAIMCAEQEPLDCHRTVLVARVLAGQGLSVDHIHRDGQVETHDDAMLRLLAGFGLDQADLFHSPEELLEEALSRQEHRIAYVDKDWHEGQALTS